jgi:HEAT repeat protein
MPVSIDVVTASGTSIRRIMLEPLPEQVIEIPSEQQPVDVIFDRGGWLLKRLHQHKPAESWIMQLHQGDVADRESALEHLGEAIDERNVLNAIGDVIAHDRFWGVRSKGAEALGLSLDGSILSMLAPALHDPEPKVRRAAAASLQAVSSEAAVGMLWTLVDRDSSDAVVGQAIASLVALDPLNGLAYCRKGLALNAHSSEICVASTHALGTLKSPEAKSLLMALSSYGQLPDVRIAAIDALAAAWPRDEAVRQRLEELLHDRLERVRRRSIEKLGIMGIIASRSMLQESLRHEEDAILRRETRRALARIDRAEKMTVHQ